MQKTKRSMPIVLFFVLVIALAISGQAIAKAQNSNGSSGADKGNGNPNLISIQEEDAIEGEVIDSDEELSEEEQERERNAGEDTEIKNQNQNQNQNAGQVNAEEHRSAVANFVQSLLDVADREGGIGEQVRVIAQEQNQVKEKVAEKIGNIETRSKIKTFFIGSDYKNLGELRSEMVQAENRIKQLTQLAQSVENEENQLELQEQIKLMEQEQTRIQDMISANEGKFSLFGWVVKLFQ